MALTFNLSNPKLWAPIYLPLINRPERRLVMYGSRDSAKSYFAAQMCIRRMLKEPTKGLMVRKVGDSIRKSQFDTIREIIERYGWQDHFIFRVSPMEIICVHNGSRMIALGLDTPNKAKSVKDPAFVWYEEADELEMEDFQQTTLSLRGKNVKEILTFNSPNEDHWLLSRFFPGSFDKDGAFHPDLSFEREDGHFHQVPSRDPSAYIIHTNYQDNPWCNEMRRVEYHWMRDNMPDDYRTKGLGLMGHIGTGSKWAKHFSRRRHVDHRAYDPGVTTHLMLDQNFLPYATMLMVQLVAVDGEKDGQRIMEVRIIREYCMTPPDNSTEDCCAEFIYEFGALRPSCYYYGDPTGNSRGPKKERNEMKSHYHVVERELRPFLHNTSNRVGKYAPSVKGRKDFMGVFLAGGTYLRLVIDPSCTNTIRDFERLVEDADGGYLKKRVTDKETGQSWEEMGHCMDAFVNFLFQCFPDLYKHHAKA